MTKNEFEDRFSESNEASPRGNAIGEDSIIGEVLDFESVPGRSLTLPDLPEKFVMSTGTCSSHEGNDSCSRDLKPSNPNSAFEGSDGHERFCNTGSLNDSKEGVNLAVSTKSGRSNNLGDEGMYGGYAGYNESENRSSHGGKLVLCPTPLGNLGDITLRTLEALKSCDVVCAEDTRVTGKLLTAYGIKKRLERLDEALIGKRADALIERVLAGEVVAYCSDAGMPGVSDPGMRLVARAHELGACVEVLPGASAAALAYVASGVACTSFYFGGFFPRKDSERRALLESLSSLDAALIFYESPHRVAEAVAVMAEVFPLRRAALCRELTKLHEEVLFLPLPELASALRQREAECGIKGEIALVIDGPSPEELQQESQACAANARDRTLELLGQGMRKKEIAKLLCEEFGLPRNAAYDLVLEVANVEK